VAVAEVVAPGKAVASVGLLWAVAALAAVAGALAAALARSPEWDLALWALLAILGAGWSVLWGRSGEELRPPARFLVTLLTLLVAAGALAGGPALGTGAEAVVVSALTAQSALTLARRAQGLLVLLALVGGFAAGLVHLGDQPFGPVWPLLGLASALAGAAVAGALRQVERALAEAAVADPLTGLPNRRALGPLLRRELARCARLGDPLTVAVVDLDGFKAVNDDRGHHGGDALLVHLARAWRGALRPFDVLARTGGDEFVLVLPATTAEEAVQVLQRLRRVHPQRFSAGVAQRTPGASPTDLLQQADAGCYAAKRLGRGRTVVVPGAADPHPPRAAGTG
jgi:diguanylate cyclase (GGDEF)-like protein